MHLLLPRTRLAEVSSEIVGTGRQHCESVGYQLPTCQPKLAGFHRLLPEFVDDAARQILRMIYDITIVAKTSRYL
jgi:hypothetical protein